MRIASSPHQSHVIQVLACIVMSGGAFDIGSAQYISFMAKDHDSRRLRHIESKSFDNQRDEIVLCEFAGDSKWLVQQRDPRSRLHELPNLVTVSLLRHDVTLEELEYVASLNNVEDIEIGTGPEGVGVSSDALGTLQKMKQLRYLRLCIHDLDDKHLHFLSGCKLLTRLTVEPASEWQWKQQTGQIEANALGVLTDSSAKLIAAAKSLEGLDVRLNHNLSDQFLLPLSKLPKLQDLAINSPLLTDDALRVIAEKLHLETLSIESPKLTDEGVVKWLTQAKTLRRIEIKSPKLTQKSVDALKQMDLKTLTVNNQYPIRERLENKIPDTQPPLTR